MTEDGEKDFRKRDTEFENDITSPEELKQKWNEGWGYLFDAINLLTSEDLSKIIYIRNQGHTVTEAINRQVAHYAYHVGQIAFVGKMICGEDWTSLSVPKGKSASYNKDKFSKSKARGHFTDEYLTK